MEDYLTKPIRAAALEAALKACQPSVIPDSPVDADLLKEASGDDPEALRELVKAVLAQAAGVMPVIGQTLEKGDAAGADSLTHRLAGAAAACGLTAFTAALQEIAKHTAAGDTKAAGVAHQSALAELGRTRQFLTSRVIPAMANDILPAESSK